MNTQQLPNIVKADGEEPVFKAGDRVIISSRLPLGHYRVPRYIRGKRCVIEAVIEPCWLNNEEEGFGRNAGQKRHYYRVAIPMGLHAKKWGIKGFRVLTVALTHARARNLRDLAATILPERARKHFLFTSADPLLEQDCDVGDGSVIHAAGVQWC